jgi:hypothetical protein
MPRKNQVISICYTFQSDSHRRFAYGSQLNRKSVLRILFPCMVAVSAFIAIILCRFSSCYFCSYCVIKRKSIVLFSIECFHRVKYQSGDAWHRQGHIRFWRHQWIHRSSSTVLGFRMFHLASSLTSKFKTFLEFCFWVFEHDIQRRKRKYIILLSSKRQLSFAFYIIYQMFVDVENLPEIVLKRNHFHKRQELWTYYHVSQHN